MKQCCRPYEIDYYKGSAMKTRPPESPQQLRQRAEELFRASENLIQEPTTAEETKHLFHELRVHQIELEMQNEELRRAQNEMETARTRYFDLYDLAPVGYLTFNDKGLVIEANLVAANMLQVSRRALLKQPVARFIYSEDQDIYYLHRRKCFASAGPQVWEMRLLRADGSLLWVRLQGTPALGGEYWITLNDISKQKQAEEALLASRANMKATLDATADGILAVGANGKVLFFNQRFAALWSIPQKILNTGDDKQLLGHVLVQLSDPEAFLLEVQRLYSLDESSFDKIDFTDGRVFERYSFPMRQEGAKALGRVWSFRDITERKRVEEALLESEYHFRSLFEGMNEGVALHTYIRNDMGAIVNYRIVAVNHAYQRILGLDKDAAIGRTGSEVYGTVDPPYLKEFSSVTISNSGFEFETYFPPMGKHFNISVVPWNKNGFATIFTDITQRKNNELQLKQFNKSLEVSLAQAVDDTHLFPEGR